MKKALVAAVMTLTVILAWFSADWVSSQTPPSDGAFVLAQDGSVWVVRNGIRYSVTLTPDTDNIVPTLPDGPVVSTAAELAAALAPPPTPVPSATPAPSPSPSVAIAPSPSPSPAPATVGGTRENPIPRGQAADLTDGWRLTVLSVTQNANADIAARNRLNASPKPGRQFFIARVTATYTGSGSKRFDGSFRLRAVGTTAVSYTTFTDSCGVAPEPISDNEVFSGGTITGNVCWSIDSADATSLLLFDAPSFGASSMRVFFSLRP